MAYPTTYNKHGAYARLAKGLRMRAGKILLLASVIAFVLSILKVSFPIPLIPTGLALLAAGILVG